MQSFWQMKKLKKHILENKKNSSGKNLEEFFVLINTYFYDKISV